MTTGPDKQELAGAWAGRHGHTDYGQYFGEALKYWPKLPIAQLIAYDGRAALQIQTEGTGYASEELLVGSTSPALLEVKGSRYRLLHLDASHNGAGAPAAVFLQSEKPDTDVESGAAILRQFANKLGLSNIRVVIRPDAWFVDESYPWFYRFILDFGGSYLFKPTPPSPRWFFSQPELTCSREASGEIHCLRRFMTQEIVTFKP